MNYVDFFIILVVLLAAVQGFYRGFITEIFSLLAFAAGILIALAFSNQIAGYLTDMPNWSVVVRVLVFAGLFLVVSYAVNMLGKLLKRLFTLALLGWLDKSLGILIGVFKWSFLVSMVIWILTSYHFTLPTKDLNKSKIYPYIEQTGPAFFEVMQNVFPIFRDWLEDKNKQQDVHFV